MLLQGCVRLWGPLVMDTRTAVAVAGWRLCGLTPISEAVQLPGLKGHRPLATPVVC